MSRRLCITLFCAFSVLLVCGMPSPSAAQMDEEIEPLEPPPLDPSTDFEELEEDMMEMGDEGFIPPPPPPPPLPGSGPGSRPPPTEFARPTPPPPPPRSSFGGGNSGGTSGKIRFELVEGEYWEKGKKRSRGPKR